MSADTMKKDHTPWHDPIVDETRALREQLMDEVGNDLGALVKYLQERDSNTQNASCLCRRDDQTWIRLGRRKSNVKPSEASA
jgi:hypothetical protein